MSPGDGQLSAFPLISLWPCLWWLMPPTCLMWWWCDGIWGLTSDNVPAARVRYGGSGSWRVSGHLVTPCVISLINSAENHVFTPTYTNMNTRYNQRWNRGSNFHPVSVWPSQFISMTRSPWDCDTSPYLWGPGPRLLVVVMFITRWSNPSYMTTKVTDNFYFHQLDSAVVSMIGRHNKSQI